jgi:hypothetical protein
LVRITWERDVCTSGVSTTSTITCPERWSSAPSECTRAADRITTACS